MREGISKYTHTLVISWLSQNFGIDLDEPTEENLRNVICDGLLCSILKAQSHMRDKIELVKLNAVESLSEIMISRTRLFSRFPATSIE